MERFLRQTTRIVNGQIGATRGGRRVGRVRFLDEWMAIADVLGPDGIVTEHYLANRRTGEIRRVP